MHLEVLFEFLIENISRKNSFASIVRADNNLSYIAEII